MMKLLRATFAGEVDARRHERISDVLTRYDLWQLQPSSHFAPDGTGEFIHHLPVTWISDENKGTAEIEIEFVTDDDDKSERLAPELRGCGFTVGEGGH